MRRPARRARPHARELQRRRPDRRRRRARRPRRRCAAEPPAGTRVIPLAGRRRLPHPLHGAGRRDAARRRPPRLDGRRPDAADLDQPRRLARSRRGAAFVDLLVGQVASPVRWDLCMAVVRRRRRHRHHRARPRRHARRPRQARACAACPTVAVKTPDDLAAAARTSDRRKPHDSPRSSSPPGPRTPASTRYGAARGELVVPNDDLVGPIDSSDEWIRQRTGIITRTRAEQGDDRDRSGDGCRAPRRSRRPASTPQQIDAVLVATISNPKQTPVDVGHRRRPGRREPRRRLRHQRRLRRLHLRRRAGRRPDPRPASAHYALVVGAEKLATVVDPTDRTISFLLGDGAGAVVIGPSDTPGIGPTVWGSDGSKADAVGMNAHARRSSATARRRGRPCARTARRSSAGRSGRWPRSPGRRSRPPGVTASDLAAFIPHQANMRIIDEFAKQLKLPEHRADRPRHRDDRQHLGRIDPARDAPPARGAPRAQRRTRPADRLRRRTGLRRPGRRPPLTSHGADPRLNTAPPGPKTPQNRRKPWHSPPTRSSPDSPSSSTTRPASRPTRSSSSKSFTDDLDIDSISMMTIVVNAEEKFDVKIPDEEVKNLKTVGDAVTFITSKRRR